MNKKGIYIFFLVYAVLAASAFTYYMLNPLTIRGPTRWPELTVTQMEFTTLSDSDVIIVHVTNTGPKTVTVAAVKINGDTQNKITGDSIHGLTFEPGDSGTITVEHDWTTENTYTARLFTSDGALVGSYTDTP